MTLAQFKQRLWTELKRSWQKSALLGLLLAVGLVFWLPPLLRMVQGGPATSSSTTPAKTLSQTDDQSPTESKPRQDFDWKDTDTILASDLLLMPERGFNLAGDPFALDYDQLAPPVLFADDEYTEEPLPASVPAPTVSTVPPPAGLLLKSTFLGTQRKAAYINRRLYFEGGQIQHGTTSWHISSIQPRRVVLSHGDQQFELRIVKSTLQNGSAVESQSARPEAASPDTRSPNTQPPGGAPPDGTSPDAASPDTASPDAAS